MLVPVQSTGTQIKSMKAARFLPQKTIVRIKGPTAAVATAMEQVVTLLSAQ